MFTKLYTIEELKEMWTEVLLNHTSKVTKITDGSVLNGTAFGNAKIGQKAIKEVAITEAHLFPNVAKGEYLDNYARLNGFGKRFGSRQSSTYIRVVAEPGTTYIPGVNVFTSTTGILFDVERVYTVGDFGYGYVKVRSQTTGSNTSVDALTINSVTNPPSGHLYCINEYEAQYGADIEDDETFSKRLREGIDTLSSGTLSMLEQIFMKINENVLKVFYNGRDASSKTIIGILTVNGIDLNNSEINDILLRAEKFLSTSEMRSIDGSGTINVILRNVEWQPIDISFRTELEASYNASLVRKEIQIRLSKYLDYRFWKTGQRVEWDTLLEIVKNTEGVKYVNDTYFYPHADIAIDVRKLPRIRGFQMLDSAGNIVQDFQGNLNPIYYPNEVDFALQAAVLQNI